MKKNLSTPLIYLMILVAVILLASGLNPTGVKPEDLEYTQLLNAIREDKVARVDVTGNELLGLYRDSKINEKSFPQSADFRVILPSREIFTADVTAIIAAKDPSVSPDALSTDEFGFKFNYNLPPEPSWLEVILPYLLIFGGMAVFYYFMMQQQGGGKVMSFGKSRAKRLTVDQPKVTFKDVAGADEAVEELEEIKEFLENPKRFQSLGARIPKGVLLFGPPGTGKTLLARAVAGEAGVPFFSISGSDFVEMFVGVGASRVRDLFEQAKQNQPCIIFIDEIDAVGRHRGAGLGGGHDEREQTLNQLLVEMDGFEANESIIIMAATNRPDILDPALLRPGRFDRQIIVDRPDREGRKAILAVHSKGKPLSPTVELDVLAAQTPGFTGADLANLVNEAALLAARRRKRIIEMDELDEAVLRVIAGPEKKSRLLSEEEKLITAYHETGHALVAHYLPNADPVHKISIISRGQALGYTITLPTEDKFMVKKKEILDKLSHMLAGRVAEEIRFDDITTGASNDLQRATETARRMITQYGMSENLGPLTFGHDPAQPFVGRDYGMGQEYSDETAEKIDAEIRRVVDEAYETANRILTEHRQELDKLSLLLIEQETIDREEFEAILAGQDPVEVFKARDEARARKSAESKRLQRQRRSREPEEVEPDGRERVATGGATPMAAHQEDQIQVP